MVAGNPATLSPAEPLLELPGSADSPMRSTDLDLDRMAQFELYSTRIDSISNFSVVSTLVFGAAVQELGGFDFEALPAYWREAYFLVIAYVTGVSLYCSLLSVLTVSAVQRIKSWDAKRMWVRTPAQAEERDSNTVVKATLALTGSSMELCKRKSLAVHLLQYMIDGAPWHTSPLGAGMRAFPLSCFLYVLAVAFRVLSTASLFLKVAGPMVLSVAGLPALYFSHHLVEILNN